MADTITRTNVNLISGVPFTSDYRHTRWFTSLAQQTTWFNQRPKIQSYATANFQRVEGRFFFDCPVNIESLNDVKYIYFHNADGAQKRYYGFVTRKEYINRHVTRVHFSLDVVQSFMFDMDFKPSYIVREHFQRYNGGKPIAQTLPEGLDYGKEYQVKDGSRVRNPQDVRFLVVVAKDRLHGADEGGAVDIFPSYIVNPQPLYYYIVPFTPDGLATSVKLKEHSFHISTPIDIMKKLETLEELAEHVVSYYVTEDIGLPISSVDPVEDNNFHKFRTNFNEYNDFWDMEVVELDGDPDGKLIYVREIKQFFPTEFTVSDNYWQRLIGTGNDMPSESKILMSPYHMIELHDYRGNVLPIRPEYIQGDKLVIVRKGSLGLSNKVTYNVKGYNMVNGVTLYAKQIENQHALVDNNPQDISVKNELLSAFLQGNRNQIANQRESAEFNAMSGFAQGLTNTASSMMKGDVLGTSSGAISSVNSLGNGILQIQGINALQSDIRNRPPNISKMGNNTAFDVGNGFTGIFVVFKGLKYEYQRVIENFFKAYGYKSNLFKVPNFRTRRHFNFVQTLNCVIQGDFSNDYLVQLQQIFDNGITLWHTDDIGNYSLSNDDLTGGG